MDDDAPRMHRPRARRIQPPQHVLAHTPASVMAPPAATPLPAALRQSVLMLALCIVVVLCISMANARSSEPRYLGKHAVLEALRAVPLTRDWIPRSVLVRTPADIPHALRVLAEDAPHPWFVKPNALTNCGIGVLRLDTPSAAAAALPRLLRAASAGADCDTCGLLLQRAVLPLPLPHAERRPTLALRIVCVRDDGGLLGVGDPMSAAWTFPHVLAYTHDPLEQRGADAEEIRTEMQLPLDVAARLDVGLRAALPSARALTIDAVVTARTPVNPHMIDDDDDGGEDSAQSAAADDAACSGPPWDLAILEVNGAFGSRWHAAPLRVPRALPLPAPARAALNWALGPLTPLRTILETATRHARMGAENLLGGRWWHELTPYATSRAAWDVTYVAQAARVQLRVGAAERALLGSRALAK